MLHIYQITEQNVDGCGTSVTEYVKASRPLSQNEAVLFQGCLEEAKASGEDLDTADIIDEAINQFNQASACKLSIAHSPLDGTFEF